MIEDSYLALSLSQSLASRAIDSIRLGGKREIRSSLELFRSFFNKLSLSYVPFYRAKYIQCFKGSPDKLIKRLVDNVDSNILKSFIVNIIYGVFLRASELKELNGRWIVDLSSSKSIAQDIKSYNKLGCYAFFINCDEALDSSLFDCINSNKRCTFFLYLDQSIKKIIDFRYKSENICYFLSNMAYNNMGAIFKREKLLYGIIKNNAIDLKLDKEIECLKLYDNKDALFVAYYNKGSKINNDIFNAIFRVRKDFNFSMAFINLNGLYKRIMHKLLED